MPGQFVLQYYVDTSRRRLKGSIDLDQCEQVTRLYMHDPSAQFSVFTFMEKDPTRF